MPQADVNWMLAACVSSSAAIVAIVGGVMGSRYIALDSEKEAAVRRRVEATSKLAVHTRAFDERMAQLCEHDTYDILDEDYVFERVLTCVHKKVPPVLDEVVEATVLQNHQDLTDLLNLRLQLLATEIPEALSVLVELVPKQLGLPHWNEFRMQHGLDPTEHSLWKKAYDFIADHLEEEAREESTILLPYSPSLRQVEPRNRYRDEERTRLQGLVDTHREAVRQLESEQQAAEEHARAIGRPEGFGLALKVLSYIALTGIALPLAFMVWAPTHLHWGLRLTVALFFLSGVVMLVRWLRVYAATVERTDVDQPPTRLWHLLRRL